MIVLLFLAAGGGYVAYTRYFAPALAPANEPQSPTLQTARVHEGDILLAATGTGNLKPETEAELAFETSGVAAEVQVEQAETDLAVAKIEAVAGVGAGRGL